MNMKQFINEIPYVELSGGKGKLRCPSAGLYSSGLRGTIEFYWENKLSNTGILNCAQKNERADFAISLMTDVGLDTKIVEAKLLELYSLTEDMLASMKEGSHEELPGAPPYENRPTGLIWRKRSMDGRIEVPLTNFAAEIIQDRCIDDGAEQQRTFTIKATVGGRETTFVVPAGKYATMSWVAECLGAEALIYPGQAIRDHTRAGIQMLSTAVEKHFVYGHLGWRRVESGWTYLHTGGAVGASVEVSVDPELSAYRLPGDDAIDIKQVVSNSLELLNVAPYEITVPLLASMHLAPLAQWLQPDFTVWLEGQTGTRKSTLVSLFMSHFGAFERTKPPAS